MTEHRSSRARAGFTLLQMLVLMTLGMAAVLVMPEVLGRFLHGVTPKTEADIRSIDSALRDYAVHHAGQYPPTLATLTSADDEGRVFLDAGAGLVDPWGVPYRYEPPSAGRLVPRVYSLGGDERIGGTGDDEDVDNLESGARDSPARASLRR